MESFQSLEDLGMFEDGKVDGRTPRSEVAFLSTATISSVPASSIFSLVELQMSEVELAFERSSRLQRFWLMLLSKRQYREKKQT